MKQIIYIYRWIELLSQCFVLIIKILIRDKCFYCVSTSHNARFPSIQIMQKATFLQRKIALIQSLARSLPQEKCIAQSLQEATTTFSYIIFGVPKSDMQFVQFAISYKDRGNTFMLDIPTIHTTPINPQVKKITTLLGRMHYFPHTMDTKVLGNIKGKFTGFFHQRLEDNFDTIQLYFRKPQIDQAAHVATMLLQRIFHYKGKVEVVIGETLDESQEEELCEPLIWQKPQ